MMHPSHPLATSNHAHAWLHSGLDADAFIHQLLGVADAGDRGVLSYALSAAATEAANPEIGLWVDDLARQGLEAIVHWSPQHCSVAVLNPHGPARNDASIGAANSYLGYAEFTFDERFALKQAGYEFLNTQPTPGALDRSRETGSMAAFLRAAATELVQPGPAELKQARASAEARAARKQSEPAVAALEF